MTPLTSYGAGGDVYESLKEGNLAELPKRTEALHGMLDTHVGLSA